MFSLLLAVLQLGTPFADGVVLQREMKVPVWGTADAGAKVEVDFGGQHLETKADDRGAWRVELAPMPASAEPRELKVHETAIAWETDAVVKDVLVGEVWFASGQSNMDCPLWVGGHTRYRDGKGAMMAAMTHLPNIRFVKSGPGTELEPKRRISIRWHKFVPEDLNRYWLSAVAFYFARELYLALEVPIAIVQASNGGTSIDPWTPRCGYENCDPCLADTAAYPLKPRSEWNEKTDRQGPISSFVQQPTILWNGSVAPWCPMAMRGFIWYQGCNNASESERYCAKLHALYNGWSKNFENPKLKMYLAQLAPYASGWLGICRAQNRFVAEQPNAALAVLADVGNSHDIHPNDKETVAQRLALQALKRDYGFAIPDSDSPQFKSVEFAGDTATLTFEHARSWYVYSPEYSRAAEFELAGTNGVWAAAKILNFRPQPDPKQWVDLYVIDSPQIVLRSDKVPAPVKVRYLGGKNPKGTMYNELSLPLGAFESDGE